MPSATAPSLTKLPAAARETAEASLAGGIRVADAVPGAVGRALTAEVKHAFVNGIHFAGTLGATLAVVSIAIVLRYLPRSSTTRAPVEQRGEDLPVADDVVEGVVGVGRT